MRSLNQENFAKKNIYHALIGQVPLSEAIYESEFPYFHICPSDNNLSGAEIELVSLFARESKLKSALAIRNQEKAYEIIYHFAQNPKDNPIVVITGQLFSFFSQLLQFHGLKDRSNKREVAAKIGVNPYFVDEYFTAARNYPMRKVSQIIQVLRDIDVKSKGVGAGSMKEDDLLKELVYKIFN